MNQVERRKDSVSAAAELLRALGRVAGIGAALYAVSYYIGWGEQAAYYAALGCPWVVPLLPTTTILQAAIMSVSLIVVFGLAATRIAIRSTEAVRTLTRLAGWSVFVIAGAASLSIILAVEGKAWEQSLYTVTVIENTIYSAAVGLLFGELVARFADSGLKWGPRHVSIVTLILLVSLGLQPWIIGNARGALDRSPATSRLAKVLIKGEVSTADWRLVSGLERDVVVVRLAPQAKDRVFRLVQPVSILSIGTTEN